MVVFRLIHSNGMDMGKGKEMSDKNPAYIWEWNHAYDYWQVQKYKRDETSRATYGTMAFRTRREAIEVCNALNAAFNAGVAYRNDNPLSNS